MSDMPLTEKQGEIKRFVEEHWVWHGTMPTVREVMQAFGFKSSQSVHGHYKALEKKGHIVRIKGQARNIRVVGGATNGPGEINKLRRIAEVLLEGDSSGALSLAKQWREAQGE